MTEKELAQYTWDIDDLLQGKTLEELYADWNQQKDALMAMYPHIFDSLSNFKAWMLDNEEFEKISNRLFNYLSNNMNEDLANPKWISWSQKLSNDLVSYNQLMSDYNNLVIEHEDFVKQALQDPELQEYQREFDLILRVKPHVLSKESELLLATVTRADDGFEDIYSSLTDNDLKFKNAQNANGDAVTLATQADIFKNLKSKDRELRRTSWLSFHEAFYDMRNTLTKALYYNYLMLNTNAKARKFNDYIARTAFGDEIPVSFIEHVYKEVKKYKPLIAKYQEARNEYLKKLINVDEIKPWDTRLDLVKKEVKFSLEEVKAEALNALSILGDEYKSHIQRAFDERWVSFLPNPNKQTGAYSIGGTKGLNKYYISMNYDETIQSIYTLVHELGHSMNSYYYGQKQKIYQETSIFYAEISSINNEMLLNHYLLNKYKDDPEMKLMILDEMISGFIATTSRQVIFSNFEWVANEWVNQGLPFTYENIEKTYYDLMSEYLPTKKTFEETMSSESKYGLVTPLRISHFFVGNFYVYKYAIGQVAAIIAADRVIKNEPGAKDRLFNFLSSGDSLSPLDTIKLLNVDLEQSQPWEEAGQILSSWIEEFVAVKNELMNK
ncbi:oligoendopeptidase F [Ureaplasma ceti]|uniref:Oligopeptidase F n=1 Tax=Ureaplasma ceti TaxID=3119530 RepID=A0ABP9U825_9BACT